MVVSTMSEPPVTALNIILVSPILHVNANYPCSVTNRKSKPNIIHHSLFKKIWAL